MLLAALPGWRPREGLPVLGPIEEGIFTLALLESQFSFSFLDIFVLFGDRNTAAYGVN